MTRAAPSLASLFLLAAAVHAQDSRATYLDALGEAARAVPPGARPAAMAHAALANARAGRADAASALAGAAAKAAVAKDRYGVENLALAGAALEAAGADGTPALRTALESLKPLPPQERAGALIAWLGALAEAPDRELLDQALIQLKGLPADRQAVVFHNALPSIRRLAADETFAAIARELLHARLGLLFFPEVVVALDALGRVPEDGSAIVWERLAACADDIDEFTVPCVVIALKGEKDPWAVALEQSEALSAGEHAYAALLVRLAAVFRLAEDRHPSAADRLEETLEAAWTFPPGHDPKRPSITRGDDVMQRVRVLYRLIPRISEACPRDRALALLTRELERAGTRERHPYVVNELLGHIAKAAERLPREDGVKLVDAVLERALAEHRAAAEIPAVLFEAMVECVRVAGAHGDRERGLSIADKVAARANEAIAAVPEEARGNAGGGPVFFPVQALFASSRTARRLGDAARADRWLDAGLSAIGALDLADQADLLVDAFATAAEVEGDTRWTVAQRVLTANGSARTLGQPWQVRDLFAAAARVVK